MPAAGTVQMKQIVVAVDGSENADRALDVAADLAARYEATLTITTVVPPPIVPTYGGPVFVPPDPAALRNAYQELLTKATARIHGVHVPHVETRLLEGIIVEELAAFVEKLRPDLLVMGSRGLSAGKRLFLGSVSDALVHHAPCPVLVVRHH